MTELLREFQIDHHPQLDETVAVIGLGYVGLPLATALARSCRDVIGFDIDENRIAELRAGKDVTQSVTASEIQSTIVEFSTESSDLARASVYIITVPTPVGDDNKPDLRALQAASANVGRHIDQGDLVICESTVYPGATEEVCAATVSSVSGLQPGTDFSVGFSPERINPGDQTNTLESTVKIIAGDTAETVERMARIYGSIVDADLHRAPCMRTAEMAKILENTQRDLNIALANETAKICALMGIETKDVISAASSKWNFVPYEPGLVGGHCISVDPYYLISRAESLGGNADVVRAGRAVNESMSQFIHDQALALLGQSDVPLDAATVGVFGISYKADVGDLRNSKSLDVIAALRKSGVQVMAFDPIVDPRKSLALGVEIMPADAAKDLDLRILAVPHTAFLAQEWRACFFSRGIFMDVKSAYKRIEMPDCVRYWSL